MAITADDLAAIRSWVGSNPDDTDLGGRWDRLGDVYVVALEVLRGRLADLIATTEMAVDGFMREGAPNAEQIKALRAQIATLEGLVPGPDPTDDTAPDTGLVSGRLVRADQGARAGDGANRRRTYAR